MFEQMIDSKICWVIIILAIFCYQQLFKSYTLLSYVSHKLLDTDLTLIHQLVNTLPLLGLFGTIVGLLDCFAQMAQGQSLNFNLNEGIARALLTTQLGLVCAIPAWLWLTSLKSKLAQIAIMSE